MLQRCEDTNLCLNWEKSHFMVKEGIVLGHKISKIGIEVDKAKVEVIAKLPHPTTVKGVRTFEALKKKLNEASILIALDWDLPFELMCDASDFAIGAVLGKRHEKYFRPIHYASKTMNEAESHYTMTEKEMLAVCMCTRSLSNLIIEPVTISKRRNLRRSKQIVEPELRTIVENPVATMADTYTMSELLQAPTEGYGDAIVIPAILAKNFKLKVGLLQLNVSHDAIKLMLFPFSLEGAARIWLEKEPPRSILTWEDLVSKFVNYFFPHSKTTNLKNDITNFQQKFDETFSITSYGYWLQVVSSGWSFVSAVLGQMTYPVSSLTLDSVRSYVMQGTPFTQGMISSISIGGSINPEGFLPSTLLMVIMVTVVIVAVILVVVIVVIFGVVVVVGGVSSIIELSFMIIGFLHIIMFHYLLHLPLGYGWAYAFHQDKASSVKVPVANVTLFSLAQLLRENTDSIRVSLGLVFLFGLSAFAIVAACASRAVATLSTTSCRMKTSRDRYGDNGVSDQIRGLVFKGSSGTGLLPNGRGMIHNELSNSAKIDLSKGYSSSRVVDLTGDEDPTDEDGDNRMSDSTGVSMSLGGEIYSGGNKSRESNISDSDNIGDGDTTVGGAIGA
ncbi:reverse transcriptase domain-containing protein [Tanacetum coccineum]